MRVGRLASTCPHSWRASCLARLRIPEYSFWRRTKTPRSRRKCSVASSGSGTTSSRRRRGRQSAVHELQSAAEAMAKTTNRSIKVSRRRRRRRWVSVWADQWIGMTMAIAAPTVRWSSRWQALCLLISSKPLEWQPSMLACSASDAGLAIYGAAHCRKSRNPYRLLPRLRQPRSVSHRTPGGVPQACRLPSPRMETHIYAPVDFFTSTRSTRCHCGVDVACCCHALLGGPTTASMRTPVDFATNAGHDAVICRRQQVRPRVGGHHG